MGIGGRFEQAAADEVGGRLAGDDDDDDADQHEAGFGVVELLVEEVEDKADTRAREHAHQRGVADVGLDHVEHPTDNLRDAHGDDGAADHLQIRCARRPQRLYGAGWQLVEVFQKTAREKAQALQEEGEVSGEFALLEGEEQQKRPGDDGDVAKHRGNRAHNQGHRAFEADRARTEYREYVGQHRCRGRGCHRVEEGGKQRGEYAVELLEAGCVGHEVGGEPDEAGDEVGHRFHEVEADEQRAAPAQREEECHACRKCHALFAVEALDCRKAACDGRGAAVREARFAVGFGRRARLHACSCSCAPAAFALLAPASSLSLSAPPVSPISGASCASASPALSPASMP